MLKREESIPLLIKRHYGWAAQLSKVVSHQYIVQPWLMICIILSAFIIKFNNYTLQYIWLICTGILPFIWLLCQGYRFYLWSKNRDRQPGMLKQIYDILLNN